MTIFNGGTFGPAVPKPSLEPLSSFSASLSVDLAWAGFGLPLGLFRSNDATALLVKAGFFVEAPAAFPLLSCRCDDDRLLDDVLLDSLLIDSPSLRFLRRESSSSPSTSE